MANEYWFVGGTSSSDTNGGGGLASRGDDLSAYMGADGEALYHVTGATYNPATGVLYKEMGFGLSLEGLYLYIEGDNVTNGRYLITDSSGSIVTIDTGLSVGTTAAENEVWVGGALATIKAAMFNGADSIVPTCSDSAKDDSRNIFIKGKQTIDTACCSWTDACPNGCIAYNNHIRFISYGTTIWDGVHTDFDGNGGAIANHHIFSIVGAAENLHFYGIGAHNTSGGNDTTTGDLVAPFWFDDDGIGGEPPKGILIYDCDIYDTEASSGYNGISINNGSISIYNSDIGWSGDIGASPIAINGGTLIVAGCRLKAREATGSGNLIGGTGGDLTVMMGCIGVNGNRVQERGAVGLYCNNTLYNVEYEGLRTNDAGSVVDEFNNVYHLRTADIPATTRAADGKGSFRLSDHSSAWSVAGQLTGTPFINRGRNVLEVDPQFVDPANGDFRVQNLAVLQGGKPDVHGRATVIGPISPELNGAKAPNRERYSKSNYGYRL